MQQATLSHTGAAGARGIASDARQAADTHGGVLVDEPSERPIEVAPSDTGEPSDVRKPRLRDRFRPGFPWGLAAGVIIAALIVVSWMGISQFLVFQRFGALGRATGSASGSIVVTPVAAGKPWFSISPAGTGTLQAWSDGGSSSGSDSGPEGAIGEIDIGVIGVVDGVTVKHGVALYLTPKTMVIIGNQAYSKGKSASVAAAIFSAEGPNGNVLEDRLLTVEFHRVGTAIVADKISAPLETGTNPLQNMRY
jgi:hypothetical protein